VLVLAVEAWPTPTLRANLLARHCSKPYYGRIRVRQLEVVTGTIELSQHGGGTD